MNINERAEEIKNSIAISELDEAINRLLDFANDYSYGFIQLKDEATFLSGRYHRLKRHQQLGVLSYEEATLEYNKITFDVTNYIEKIIQYNTEDVTPKQNRLSGYEKAKKAFLSKIDEKKDDENYNKVFVGKKLNKTYRKNSNFRLNDIDITLKIGEVTGITGENAAGKTSLLSIIAGEITKNGGEISYPHLITKKQKNWYHIKRQIAYIPQSIDKQYGKIKDSLHFEAAARGIKGIDNEKEVAWIIERLGLREYQDFSWNEISGGYKMRFELAKMLVWKPKLLILDEPLAHLDVNVQAQFLNDLRDIANSSAYPFSIIISSQHISEIERICNNMYFFKEGEVLFQGSLNLLAQQGQENVFELGSSMSVDVLTEKIKSLPILNLKRRGDELIINVPSYYSSDQFLKNLRYENIPVTYFREITASTKKLFS
jgi:ABC-2 type transport system ATP-binding protein